MPASSPCVAYPGCVHMCRHLAWEVPGRSMGQLRMRGEPPTGEPVGSVHAMG